MSQKENQGKMIMKFRTTIEIDITDNSRPSEQDVKDLMAKIIGYGSLNIKQNAQHIPIKQASFNITRTEDITAWAAAMERHRQGEVK